jgi:hypothetical protein
MTPSNQDQACVELPNAKTYVLSKKRKLKSQLFTAPGPAAAYPSPYCLALSTDITSWHAKTKGMHVMALTRAPWLLHHFSRARLKIGQNNAVALATVRC